MDKKAYEKRATERLKELYPEFPEGIIEYDEEPDARVRTQVGCTGIEITDYFRPEQQNGSPLQEQESLTHSVASRASALYPSTEPPVWATLMFTKDVRLSKRDVNSIAASLVAAVREATGSGRSRVANEGQLPESIDAIVLYPLGVGKTTEFTVAGTTWPPEIDHDEVARIIAGKERKLPAYRKACAPVWLLIVVNGFRLSSMTSSPAGLENAFQSTFDRVLLLHDDRTVVRVA